MPRVRLTFEDLTLFEDEEAGDTHVAVYASVTDANGSSLATFKWNNRGTKVNETNTYSLAVDPGIPNVVDFDLATWATISVAGFADDDQDWPSAGSNENSLGSANVTIDGRVPSTLGSLVIGPTTTDNGNTGFNVAIHAETVAAPAPAELRLTFHNVLVLEDEELGDTHMALYMHARAPAQGGVAAIESELLRWNNGGGTVNEVNSYPLSNGGVTTTVRVNVGGPTQIWVEGYADDDQNWPNAQSNENSLGEATITVDPVDPSTLGGRQMGPTTTDNGNHGYTIDLTAEVIPAGTTPDLAIIGVELTQAVQRFASTTGPDNSAPLVAHKATLVRVYLDSGTDPSSPGGGTIADVTGVLTVSGSSNATQTATGFTARPASQVDRAQLDHTLNFLLPPNLCTGALTLTAQASVVGSTSAPLQLNATFRPVVPRNILMLRIGTPAVPPPDQATYLAALNALTTIYPIPTDPGEAIVYWIDPGHETYITSRNLNKKKPDGSEDISDMDDLLEDIEDIQEDGEDWQKLYGLIPSGVPMNRIGDSTENQAYGYAGLTGSVAHELGHLYDLKHAPCPKTGPPGVKPDKTDDDFVPASGNTGDVGVDVLAGSVFPATDGDFMSYCSPSWISAYHWSKLFGHFQER
jgi:hypothetical protein